MRLSFNPSSPASNYAPHGFNIPDTSVNSASLDHKVVEYVRNLGFSVVSGQTPEQGKLA